MKAMIFAAGLGTRLRPLTNDRPKALVEIGGKTMLERVIMKLAEAGFDDITINIHHFGQKIIDFLEANDNFGLNLHISDERDKLLDTGGGILKARQFLDGEEPFLVHNADILTDIDLRAMYQSHVESGAMATVLVKERKTSRYFVFDDNYRLQGWINKSTGETRPAHFLYKKGMHELAFGGIHVISPSIFEELERYSQGQAKFSTTPFYVDECHNHLIKGYVQETPYTWLDVGKPETLKEAEDIIKKMSSF
ncbi:MAG: nucleotidyltransferase family protein [Muribaculaceae bacterium]|nr:nucleotidyltransferase family protein [Muribaculaceae bacterium]